MTPDPSDGPVIVPRSAKSHIEAQLVAIERDDPGFIEAVKAYYGVGR